MKLILIALSLGLVTSTAFGSPRKGATVEGITEYTLDNGLRVLLFPEASKPTITVNITYLVGSRQEGYGETGMAHLLEHMMFKGTPKHSKVLGELESRGARSNGTTDADRTNFFETLGASPENLKWAIDLEADRMVHAKISADDLKTEFSVVRNEFELGESTPDNVLMERMLESAYLWHNYGKPTIGSRSDIERVPAESLRAFYGRYYQPDNAVLLIAGKFDPAAALKEIQASFGLIPRPKRKLPGTYTVEPEQDGERTVTLERTGDVQLVSLMYHGVSQADPDAAAEQALLDILVSQPSGRLYKALVDTSMAARLDQQGLLWLEPGVFFITATVSADKPLLPVRDKMISVAEGLAKTEITNEEFERWKAHALRDIELGLTDPERIGVELSDWMASDWRMKYVYRDRVKALTASQVRAFAAKYLKASNRTVGLFRPTKLPDRSPLPGTPDIKALVASYQGQPTIAAGETFEASLDNLEKRTERVTLPNGLKLALLPKRTRGGTVEVLLKVKSGSETELRGKVEVAELLRDAVLRGTKKHSFQQIKDLLDKLKTELRETGGITLGSGGASYQLATVRDSLPRLLPLLAEIVREPALKADQVDLLKKEQLSRAQESLQQPMAAGFLALFQKASPWPKDDPRYVPSVLEEIERIKAITPEQLAQFHDQYWGGSGAQLVLVGDFDPAQVKAIVTKELGDWRAPKPWVRMPNPSRPTQAGEQTIALADKASAFAGAAISFPMRDDDPEYPALVLGSYLYGGGPKSRLWERLREKEGLSYGVFAFANASSFDLNTMFLAAAFCAPQNAKKAMASILDELQKMLATPVSDAELHIAKKGYQAQFDTGLTVDPELVGNMNEQLETGRTFAYNAKLNAQVQAVTAAQLAAVLKKYVKLEGLAKVEAGDIK